MSNNHIKNGSNDVSKDISKNIPENTTYTNTTYTNTPNICLIIFDILLLPIHVFRMILIYFFGSKYNLKGFQFLDVIMHADKPYFNQEDCKMINTIETDYRIVIRDDSRIFPADLNNYLELKQNELKQNEFKQNEFKQNELKQTELIAKNKNFNYDDNVLDKIIVGSTMTCLPIKCDADNSDKIKKNIDILNSIHDELTNILND